MRETPYMRYDQLDVYKRAYALALRVHTASLDMPRHEQYGGMADQMRRASKSICANMAEGLGKLSSDAEQKRFLSMALGSCEEMNVWTQFSTDLGYLPPAITQDWQNEYRQIAPMIFGLMKKRA